ncbi:redox-regulated ATPase YchF [Paremcibacter congregatus]|uniref:Ribosome-binding ATPase YchF n=1 Tax=Paremcibacter congregatus TaxID=2043170 RepID=A0A2G4YV68_9PROT|nr:redox-regulated ATPase YchF [Paremcibacter congregatus]PHZ86244.1 redox-regulated ATPase YchF [Paremcibacter congregatus]QDE27210.1 redox-regulated ATPase YchF [Paremcibacter congregatus]|tara:strand:+ start:212 stop:1315 length:1104 start_codon:yes stop_codon:yes gene_type:complete
MGFKCGIVGLPNVGKSTLFNALTNTAAAAAANYPFCTIEPNVGQVPVPDPRLNQLAAIAGSKEIIPTQLSFVDIAGLVRGASQGEGLGNQFLGNIREVDAIIHVLRCFEDDDITHVEGTIDPIADAETVETELMLSDIDSLTKRKSGLERRIRGQDKDAKALMALAERMLAVLEEGQPARVVEAADEEEQKLIDELQLLTTKPVLYVCNVSEEEAAEGNALSTRVAEKAKAENAVSVIISAALESEIAQLEDEEEQKAFLEDLGLGETGLGRVIRAGYDLLNLITYFTVGPKEARAWTVTQNTKAPQAAGVIHTDFETGFIRAETIAFDAYIEHKGETGCKDAGKMRLEGKEYVVADGDVLHFRFAN